MRKTLIAGALIVSLAATPVFAATDFENSFVTISDSERATGSNASPEEEETPDIEKEIMSIELDVDYEKNFHNGIHVNIKTPNCVVSNVNVIQYNRAEIVINALDGYQFGFIGRIKAKVNGANFYDKKRRSSDSIVVIISNDASPESFDSDTIEDEFGKTIERFRNIMNDMKTLGIRMEEANTREDIRKLIIRKLNNEKTDNIDFEVTVYEQGPTPLYHFTPAIAGTPNNPDGINGKFSFSVDVWVKENEKEKETIKEYYIHIYATRYNTNSYNDHEKNIVYDNNVDDTISFYKNGKLVTVPCRIHYNNYRKGTYTTLKYNSIQMEDFNGKTPNLIYNYEVIETGKYAGTYTDIYIYSNGKRVQILGGPNSSWIKFNKNQVSIPIPCDSFSEGDYIDIYIDGSYSNSGSSGSSGSGSGSSGGSGGGGGGGGGSSSSSTGATSSGMLITKPNATSGIWEMSDEKWKLKLSDGSYASSQWAILDGKWYMFDGSGYMVTGWKKANTKWYLMSTNGDMVTGWQLVDEKWYYLEPSGEMVTGWKWVGEKCYYMDESGAMLTNSKTPDGYEVNENGEWIQ